MFKEFGINYNNLPEIHKKGSFIYRKRKKSNDHSTKTTPTPQIISDSSDTQSYAEVTSGKNNTVEDLMTAVTSFVKKAERALPEPDLNHEVQA